MFDRLLLILLILLLPLGVVASRFISGEVNLGKATSEEQEKKIETLINNLTQKTQIGGEEKENISITGILYASESGKLKIAGTSREQQANFWVWWAGNKKRTDTKQASGSAKTVDFDGPVVYRPNTGGSFALEIDVSDYSGILEIRLQQAKQDFIIRYDLEKKKQLEN